MKNIHLILVNKVAASLYHCSNTRDFFTTRQTPDDLLYEMYITSDEEIKEGDWALQFNDIGTEPKIVFKTDYQVPPECVVKKIVLTTDEYLINDDAQAIDDEFLEWFVKNPSFEEVEVKEVYPLTCCIQKEGKTKMNNGCMERNRCLNYKIIIPKEEPKQIDEKGRLMTYWGGLEKAKKETLEDLVDKKAEQNNTIDLNAYAIGLSDGAKWLQERSYSEEEVIKIVEKSRETGLTAEYLLLTEQFKKK